MKSLQVLSSEERPRSFAVIFQTREHSHNPDIWTRIFGQLVTSGQLVWGQSLSRRLPRALLSARPPGTGDFSLLPVLAQPFAFQVLRAGQPQLSFSWASVAESEPRALKPE